MQRAQTKRGLSDRLSQKTIPYLFIAPAVLYFLLLSILPALMAFPISLTDWSALSPNRNFVGLANYQKLLNDRDFWRSVGIMSQFFLYVPLVMSLGLGAALLLNTGVKGVKLFRVTFYAPVVTSTVAIAILFEWFYQPAFGLFNNVLRSLHLAPSGWLTKPGSAVMSVMLFKLWRGFGGSMLIYLAGLQGVDREIREAADMDGASAVQKFLRITFPLLKPAHTYLLITNIIGVFMIFQETYMLKGVLNSTRTVLNYIYERAFTSYQMGYASAMSFVVFVLVIAITAIQYRAMRLDDQLD